jgi:peptide/nickel transport system substrate-binding protein
MTVDPSDPQHVTIDYQDNTGINLLYDFAFRDGMIMSTKSIVDGTADKQPVGAGPFMLTDYQKGAKASLRPNPNYWDKANTYKFGGIDYIKVGTGPPTITALQAGQLDFARIETDGAEALIRVNGPRVSVLQLRADDANAARTLLAAARARGESLHYVNVPEGDPASQALADLGAKLDLRQRELQLSH